MMSAIRGDPKAAIVRKVQGMLCCTSQTNVDKEEVGSKIENILQISFMNCSLLNEGVCLWVWGHVAGGGRHDCQEEQGEDELD